MDLKIDPLETWYGFCSAFPFPHDIGMLLLYIGYGKDVGKLFGAGIVVCSRVVNNEL